MPGAISVTISPASVCRSTQRSVTTVTSWRCARPRRPLKVTCSTSGTSFWILPSCRIARRPSSIATSSPAVVKVPPNTSLRPRAVMSMKPPTPAVR